MQKIRVLVAENHEGMRSGIVELLGKTFQVVGAVDDGEKLVKSAIHLLPDVIVSNISIPAMDGFAARRKLMERWGPVPFVFVSTLGREIVQSVQPGSLVSLVYKDEIADHLGNAVAAVFIGLPYLSPYYRD